MTANRPALVALWALALAAAAAADNGVTIQTTDTGKLLLSDAEKPLYAVDARTYRAEVYRTGRVRILAGQTELVRNLVVQLGRNVKTLGRIRREKGDRIVLQEGAVAKKGPGAGAADDAGGGAAAGDLGATAKLPALPGVRLHFLPGKIEISAVATGKGKSKKKDPSKAIDIAGVFGDDALAIRNVRNGVEDALPARYICSRHIFSFYGWYGHYWPDVDVGFADGTQLRLRGITGVSHYRISGRDPYAHEALKGRRGFWQLREAGTGEALTLTVSPAKAAAALAPAPYCTIRPDKPRGLFYRDEPVVFHLDFAEGYLTPGKWRVSWKLEDHQQRPAGSGEQEVVLAAKKQSPVAVRLKPEGMGYFRATITLARVDGKSARRTHEVGLARIRPEAPKLRDLDGKGGGDGEMLWANILGMRGIRLNPSWANNRRRHGRPDGSIDWAAWRKDYERTVGLARQGTVKGLCSFTGADWHNDMAKWFEKKYPDAAERKAKIAEAKRRYLTEQAREAARVGVTAWEPINEPNLQMSPEKYIAEVLKVQYPAVKAGNPKANFLGGSICGLENHKWVRRLYELGGQEFFDGISFHPYTGLGFQEAYRAELDAWWQILRDYKDTRAGGVWMTESAWHRGWGYNDYTYDRFGAFRQSEARNAVLMHLHAEATAIPRERIYVFYLLEHGYNDFYLLWREHATSAAISIQVMNECLRDARFVEEVPLPGNGHYFQLYRDKARTVAACFTAGEPAKLTLATDAKLVTVTDLMGNRRTVAPAGGRLSVTIGGDPTYLAVGAGETIRPAYALLRVQPNLALTTLGATVSVASVAKPPKGREPLPASAAICGDWTCYAGPGAWNGARRGWDEAEEGKDKFPDTFEVRLAAPAEVARVRVYHDYGAWDRLLCDFDVQVHAGGAWKTVASVRDNRYGYVHDLGFAPVRTDRVRLLIHKVNACFFESMEWIPKLSTLRAMEVYAAPGGPAKAFFVQEIPRRRIVAPGGTVKLRFCLRNVLADKVSGEVRLQLPRGLTADPATRKLTLPPGGQAECSFDVRIAKDAPHGLHTVLAGLYDGAALISADRAARVLCCKKK